jgi:2-polyprenyl-6-methoxyphenol hydroxylase-like FAD-dependent oxidoreductase
VSVSAHGRSKALIPEREQRAGSLVLAPKIVVVGGGIAGLGFALSMAQRGLACEVYEAVGEVKELGVGITLLPHAMRELAALGVQPQIEAAGIENLESVFYNRYGQYIYRELRGRHAGYALPEIGIHRGKLHRILWERAVDVLEPAHLHTGHRCTGVEQDATGATVHFAGPDGAPRASVRADIVIACDGVNSTVRRQFYPDERLAFAGINTWRGITVHPPILIGKSYLRVGSIETGKMVIYPIVNDVDGQGNQLINWMAEIQGDRATMNDWNQRGDRADFEAIYADWRFPWLDVTRLIADAQQVLEYPMVDKDPVAQWTFGCVTLMGDAAHPMYPRGSNGAAQGLIDARTLAELLATAADAREALQRYDEQRRPVTARIVQTNRTTPPDFINTKVDQLSGGQPFRHIDDLISQDELRRISEDYQRIAGFSREALRG